MKFALILRLAVALQNGMFLLATTGTAQETPPKTAPSGLSPVNVWRERILNKDGTIAWAEYEKVALNAGTSEQRDYLLGPRYSHYPRPAEACPTLELQGDSDGWEGPVDKKQYLRNGGGAPGEIDWYAQAGVVLYAADDPATPGVISAGNGECYLYEASIKPPYGFLCNVNWRTRRCCYLYPNPPELRQPDWGSPHKPVAVATPKGTQAIAQYVAFQDGFIGTFALDKCAYTHQWSCDAVGNYQVTGNIFPWVRLPAGKVPMGLAVTPCGEFLLAAVWDVVHHRGQMAVIAVQGRVRCSETKNRDWSSYFGTGTYLYGFPNWPNTKALKLLGFVDLPIAAPMGITAGTSMGWQNNGRDDDNVNANLGALLDSQQERDRWRDSDPGVYPNYKATAHAGYALISSRAENKVVLVDLQPLLEFYRAMYFTSQARYDETKQTGPAGNQWPYTFEHRPEQKPVVALTITVPAPTAVAAGLSIGHCTGCNACNSSRNKTREWRETPFGGDYGYVTTMEGELQIYNVARINGKPDAAPPSLEKTIAIGKNPTSIENGNGGIYKNDIFINCRGDRSVFVLEPGGKINDVLRDSRIQDPVMAENSYVGRRDINRHFVHVVDFASQTILTYVYQQDFKTPMKFGARSERIPGRPFAYQQDEVP